MAFHANISGFTGGYAGVDVFFVISGYLITGLILPQIERGTFSFAEFYVRRINRILPALIVVLVASFAIGWLVLVPGEFRQLGTHILGGSTFSSNFILWNESGYFDSPDKPLLHLWSLAVEEQFYLGWPVLAWLAWKKKWSVRSIVTAVVVTSFVMNLLALAQSLGSAAFYSPVTRLWEIMIGGLLVHTSLSSQAHEQSGTRSMPARNTLSVAGTALLGATFVLLNRDTPWPGWWATLPVIATVSIIAAGEEAWLNKRIFSNRALVFVGLVSYPLYLWHWPLIVFARIVKGRMLSPMAMFVVILISILLSILTYRVVEVPIRFGGRKRRSAALLLASLGLVAVLGFSVQHGFINPRLDGASVAKIDSATRDWTYPGEGGFAPGDGRMIVHTIPGDTNRIVVVMGDSHAEQYWPRMVELARVAVGRQPEIRFTTYGGCSPFPNVDRRGFDWTGAPYRCSDYHRKAMEIARDKRVVAVVLSFWWRVNFDSDRYLNTNPKKDTLRSLGPDALLPFQALGLEISELTSAGKKVYVVLANPNSIAYRPTSLLRGRLPYLSSRDPVTSIPRKTHESFEAFTNSQLRALASQTGAVIIDPADYLCGPAECSVIGPTGDPIYKDGNHMRASFARDHASFIDRVLDK